MMPFTMDKLQMLGIHILDMDRALCSTLMEGYLRATGLEIKEKVKAMNYLIMEIHTKENIIQVIRTVTDLGRPHGKGVYRWNTGEVYEGEFKNGFKSGYGMWRGKAGVHSLKGLIKTLTWGYGKMGKLMVMVCMCGEMATSMKENGQSI
jgi:hypothetical protein